MTIDIIHWIIQNTIKASSCLTLPSQTSQPRCFAAKSNSVWQKLKSFLSVLHRSYQVLSLPAPCPNTMFQHAASHITPLCVLGYRWWCTLIRLALCARLAWLGFWPLKHIFSSIYLVLKALAHAFSSFILTVTFLGVSGFPISHFVPLHLIQTPAAKIIFSLAAQLILLPSLCMLIHVQLLGLTCGASQKAPQVRLNLPTQQLFAIGSGG